MDTPLELPVASLGVHFQHIERRHQPLLDKQPIFTDHSGYEVRGPGGFAEHHFQNHQYVDWMPEPVTDPILRADEPPLEIKVAFDEDIWAASRVPTKRERINAIAPDEVVIYDSE